MADNQNLNSDNNQGQDPFAHPIRRNNWWMYILGGLCFAGLIIWFFIDWSYKDRKTSPEDELPTQKQIEKVVDQEAAQLPQDTAVTEETLPQITVEGQEPAAE